MSVNEIPLMINVFNSADEPMIFWILLNDKVEFIKFNSDITIALVLSIFIDETSRNVEESSFSSIRELMIV